MGNVAGKIWGKTEQILANSSLEFHRIESHAGTKCSKHKHRYKWNAFYVEKGILVVRVWKNDYALVDETILHPGEFTEVKPGDYHEFECVEDCVAFELYYANFDHNDIQRENVGGTVFRGLPSSSVHPLGIKPSPDDALNATGHSVSYDPDDNGRSNN